MGPRAKGERPYVYIYGVREAGGWNKQLLLARAPSDQIENFTTWEFRGVDEWTTHVAEARSLAEGMVNEFSISSTVATEERSWIMVHSEPLFGPRIMVRRSRHAEGPWSKPQAVFRVDDIDRHKSYFTYAAKAHADLSAPDELLISYVVNSHDFGAMVRDADIYRPRFVRLRMDAD